MQRKQMQKEHKRESGYYEISMRARYFSDMQVSALAGNVIYNRLHWHRHLEIMCCVKGSFSMRVEGEIFRLMPGDFVTVNCDAAHEIFDGTRDGLQIIFSIDPAVLRKMPGERYQFSTVGENAVPKNSKDAVSFRRSAGRIAWMLALDKRRFKGMMEQMGIETSWLGKRTEPAHGETQKKAGPDEKSEAGTDFLSQYILQTEEEWYAYQREVYQCLYCMARHKINAPQGKERAEGRDLFRRCVEQIQKEYDGELNAEILSRQVGLSEPTIYRMFQKNLGVSLNSYIQMVRIRAVQERLEQTEEDITEIAFSCGFTSLSNFYRVFHELQGQTPKEYRRQRKKDTAFWKNGQQAIMNLNDFQNFFELPYQREELLEF